VKRVRGELHAGSGARGLSHRALAHPCHARGPTDACVPANAAVCGVGRQIHAGAGAVRQAATARLAAGAKIAHQIGRTLGVAGSAVIRVGLKLHALAATGGLPGGTHALALQAGHLIGAGVSARAAVRLVRAQVDARTGARG